MFLGDNVLIIGQLISQVRSGPFISKSSITVDQTTNLNNTLQTKYM